MTKDEHSLRLKTKDSNDWIAGTGGFLAQSIREIGRSILPLELMVFVGALGISNADVGVVLSIYGVFFAAGSLFWGVIADRIELRIVLALSSLLASIGIFGMGGVNSFTQCLVFYALIGFGSAAIVSLIPKLASTYFSSQRRGIASSYIYSGGTVTAAILGIVVPLLVNSHDWRLPFYALGSIGIVGSFSIFFLVKKRTYEIQKQKAKTKNVLMMKTTWHIATIHAALFSAALLINAFLAGYLTEIGFSLVSAGFAFSVFTAAKFIGQYTFGILSDYIPRKFVLSFIAFLLVVSMTIFISLRTGELGTYALVFSIGLSVGCTPVLYAISCDNFRTNVLGTATGIAMFMDGLGSIFVPAAAGYLATAAETLAAVFQLSIGLAFAGAILSLVLKRQPESKQNRAPDKTNQVTC
ncbi:MAG: nitrate/nitrite transporter [Candidatus Bathyarchaeia archaeon]